MKCTPLIFYNYKMREAKKVYCLVDGLLVLLFFLISLFLSLQPLTLHLCFVAMQMSGGRPNPRIAMRLLWGVVIGLTGFIFQLTGGFNAIKSLAIVVGHHSSLSVYHLFSRSMPC